MTRSRVFAEAHGNLLQADFVFPPEGALAAVAADEYLHQADL